MAASKLLISYNASMHLIICFPCRFVHVLLNFEPYRYYIGIYDKILTYSATYVTTFVKLTIIFSPAALYVELIPNIVPGKKLRTVNVKGQ